jgi:hypothetical protein
MTVHSAAYRKTAVVRWKTPTTPANAAYRREVEEADRRWTVLLVAALSGVALYGLYRVVQALPPHSKTLARDAVILGFAGAALLIQEFVRSLLALRYIAGVIWLFAASSLVAIVAGALGVQWWGAALVLGVPGVILKLLIQEHAPDPGSETMLWLRTKVLSRVIRYGPVVLGLVLLALSMFLQLRAIDLSRD